MTKYYRTKTGVQKERPGKLAGTTYDWNAFQKKMAGKGYTKKQLSAMYEKSKPRKYNR